LILTFSFTGSTANTLVCNFICHTVYYLLTLFYNELLVF
jgi:hypothetical protein